MQQKIELRERENYNTDKLREIECGGRFVILINNRVHVHQPLGITTINFLHVRVFTVLPYISARRSEFNVLLLLLICVPYAC